MFGCLRTRVLKFYNFKAKVLEFNRKKDRSSRPLDSPPCLKLEDEKDMHHKATV